MKNVEKYIFTFWEPASKIPDYLKLCMQTWSKFLPEYKIITLDYENLKEWLGEDFYEIKTLKKFSLPKQADAIRCSLLCKYGGIWMDCDTIITSEGIREFLNLASESVFIDKHIGFIFAKNNALILQEWEKRIRENIIAFEKFHSNPLNKFLNRKENKRLKGWDYLGNSILNEYFETLPKEKYYPLNKSELYVLPEENFLKENNLNFSSVESYRNFYFESDNSDYVLKNSKYIICLHNSWTPKIYKEMSKEEFLDKNNTIAKVLKHYLYY